MQKKPSCKAAAHMPEALAHLHDLHLTLHPRVVAVIAPVGWQVKGNAQAHCPCSQVLLHGQHTQDM